MKVSYGVIKQQSVCSQQNLSRLLWMKRTHCRCSHGTARFPGGDASRQPPATAGGVQAHSAVSVAVDVTESRSSAADAPGSDSSCELISDARAICVGVSSVAAAEMGFRSCRPHAPCRNLEPSVRFSPPGQTHTRWSLECSSTRLVLSVQDGRDFV